MFINGKGFKNLQCQYNTQKKSWMDSAIIEQYVWIFNVKFH